MSDATALLQQIMSFSSIASGMFFITTFGMVKRWHAYPMHLLLDLAVFQLFFSIFHEVCVREDAKVWYYLTNVCRASVRAWVLCIAFRLYQQISRARSNHVAKRRESGVGSRVSKRAVWYGP